MTSRAIILILGHLLIDLLRKNMTVILPPSPVIVAVGLQGVLDPNKSNFD
jgi:hypothetical protein